MEDRNKMVHDINSCINSLEQGFHMLCNEQLGDEKLKEQLLNLMSEQSNKLKDNWTSFKNLENVASANS